MDWLTNPEVWTALLTLTFLEVILGVDNVIFISILASKLPKEEQDRARVIGLSLAALTRILFLLSVAWIMALKRPLFALLGHEVTGKDQVHCRGALPDLQKRGVWGRYNAPLFRAEIHGLPHALRRST